MKEKPKRLARFKAKLMLRSIILMTVNAVLIVASIIVLNMARNIASKSSDLSGKKLISQTDVQARVLQAALVKTAPKINRIESALADDQRFLEFVQEMDFLRAEGVLTRFSIESDKFQDKATNSPGTKLLLQLSGDQIRVNAALEKIYSLNYIFRPEITTLVRGAENQITYTITGVLYVQNLN